MQVILLEKVLGLGDIGSIVQVKDGFARNYLIPRQKVLRATSANRKIFEERKAHLEKQNADKHAAAITKFDLLNGKAFVMIRQAAEDGRLYGSVTARDIAAIISAETEVSVTDDMIVIGTKIKNISLHTVSIVLHPDVIANVNINVARTAQEALAASNKDNKKDEKSDIESNLQ